MRVKEAIFKITSHPVFHELDKLASTDVETFKIRYEGKRINIYPDYSQGLWPYRIEKMRKQLPQIEMRYTFQFGEWGKITAFISILANEWFRRNGEIFTSLSFNFTDYRIPKAIYETRFVLPASLDLDNPEKHLKKILRAYLFEEGFLARLQIKFRLKKSEVAGYYKSFSYYKYGTGISDSAVYKWVAKHFNIDSDLSIEDTIFYVNKLGKQPKLVRLDRYDHSWIYDFDGDIDEIENEFWETVGDDTIYV